MRAWARRCGPQAATRRTWLIVLAALVPSGATPAAQAPAISVASKEVPLAEHLGPGERIGMLRPRGMLALKNPSVKRMRFAQLSALAWDDDEGILYALSDKGSLFHLRPIMRDETLVDVELIDAVPLRELGTDVPLKGRRADSEGMDILNGRNGRKGDAQLLISFERFPRIVTYRPDGHAIRGYPLPTPLQDAGAYRDSNKMLEAVCHDSQLGILTTPEAPLKSEIKGLTRIFALSGRSWRYRLDAGSRISAMECLGNGRLLILERDFGRLFGRYVVSLKLATLPRKPPVADSVPITTATVLDAGKGFHIDNFEGLARHRGNRYFMISDDNDLFVQHTLLLYFELLAQ